MTQFEMVTAGLIMVILAGLGVWRVSRILALEDGPFDVFANVRGRIDSNQKTFIGRGINCVLCVSFWLALLAALLLQLSVLDWLAIAAIAAALHQALR